MTRCVLGKEMKSLAQRHKETEDRKAKETQKGEVVVPAKPVRGQKADSEGTNVLVDSRKREAAQVAGKVTEQAAQRKKTRRDK